MWSALVLHQLISLRLVTIGVSLCLEDSLQTAFFLQEFIMVLHDGVVVVNAPR